MFALILGLLSLAQAAPVTMAHQARLVDTLGTPISVNNTSVRVSLWTAQSGGTEEWSEVHTGIDISGGYIALELGTVTTLDSSEFASGDRWLELQIGTDPAMSRVAIHTVPTAAVAQHAITATSADTATTATSAATADAISGDLVVNGALSSAETWGISARTQGLIAMPEGQVFQSDDTLTFTGDVIIMNPAAGSFMRVDAGSYTLGAWDYLYVDLPPTGSRTPVAASVGSWSDSDRNYDHPDRFVLAQRRSGGLIYLNMAISAQSMAQPSRLITKTSGSLGDQRNDASKSTAGTWWNIPGRTLTFTKRFTSSQLKITYQDTFGTLGRVYAGCEWRILIDGVPLHAFSTADHDRGAGETTDWTMNTATQTTWSASPGTGTRTITVQNRGQRGAWGAGTDSCLMGWNTSSNFISVEEIP